MANTLPEPLNRETWDGLIKKYVIPMFGGQIQDDGKFDAMIDLTFEMVVEQKWTVPQTTWAVKRVCRFYRKLDNLLAMLSQSEAGQRSLSGDVMGGWQQSRECLALRSAAQDERDQRQCIEELGDGFRNPRDCGTRDCCAGCLKLAERQTRRNPVIITGKTSTGHEVKKYQPRTVGEIAAEMAER